MDSAIGRRNRIKARVDAYLVEHGSAWSCEWTDHNMRLTFVFKGKWLGVGSERIRLGDSDDEAFQKGVNLFLDYSWGKIGGIV